MNKTVVISLSVIAAVIGLSLWGVAVFSLIHSMRDTGSFVSAPGDTTITISKPGDYTLWNQTAGAVGGQFKTFPETLPAGMTVTAVRKSDGAQIPMRGSMNSSVESNGTKRKSIGEFTFDRPGQYQIEVTGFTDQRAFYLDESKFLRAFATFFLSGIAGMFFVIAGIALGVYALIQFTKKTAAKT